MNTTVLSSGSWDAIQVAGCDAAAPANVSVVASTTAADSGEAIEAMRAEVRLSGTLLAGGCNLDSPIDSLGHNLDSDGTCGLTDPTDLSGVDPMLGPLQDNGGLTPTHALLAGSPAIDAIPSADCTYDDDADPGTPEVPLATDQRGISRPQGSRCDIGAFERTISCGLGAELALLVPLLGALRRRRSGASRGSRPTRRPVDSWDTSDT